MERKSGNWQEALFYLLASGAFIGLIFPMAQLAAQNGISPVTYSGFSALGASIVLLLASLMSGQRIKLSGQNMLFAAISGLFTYVFSWGVIIYVIPTTGAAVPAVLQSSTPLLTLFIALIVRLENPNLGRTISLTLGLAGVLLVLLPRLEGSDSTSIEPWWYLLVLVAPVSLAIGNVYRTMRWPQGAEPLALATLTLAAAGFAIISFGTVSSAVGISKSFFGDLIVGWKMIAFQSVLTGIGYLFFFRLQKVGGPVYLSQLSYVNTAVGLGFATTVFKEQLPLSVWASVALIVAGITLMAVMQRKDTSDSGQ